MRAPSATNSGPPNCRWGQDPDRVATSPAIRSTRSWCASLHDGDFLKTQGRNAVCIGGTGTGKTHISASRSPPSPVRRGARARGFNLIDLVNRLEAEARAGRAGRLAEPAHPRRSRRAGRTGVSALLPEWGGQLLFHLISKLYLPHLGFDQHQPWLRPMAVGVRRQCQDDSRSARPANSSLRYPGNRKRKLPPQDQVMTASP